MGAPEGNSFWKSRSRHGRDKLFSTPILLWQAAEQYFETTDESWWPVNGQLRRLPYTLEGFIIYIGASESYWRAFRRNIFKDLENNEPQTLSKDFLSVIERIETVIKNQKMIGAMIGAFNGNIVSRELGMADKIETRAVDKDGNDVQPAAAPPAQIILVQRKTGEAIDDEIDIKESED